MRVLPSLLAAAALMWSGAAFADEVAFTVPVRITNMTGLASVDVYCNVSSATRALTAAPRTRVPLSGGAYSGDITVRALLPPGVRLAEATRWRCGFVMVARASDGRTLPLSGNTEAALAAAYTTVSGQVIVSSDLRIEGDIPR